MEWLLNVFTSLTAKIAIPILMFIFNLMRRTRVVVTVSNRLSCEVRNSHEWHFRRYKQPKATLECVRCQRQKTIIVPPSPMVFMVPGGMDEHDKWVQDIVDRANNDQ